MRRLPMSFTFSAVALAYLAAAAALALWLSRWLAPAGAFAAALALLAPLLVYHVRRLFAPMRSLFRALAGTVASYRDGDFSFGLSWRGSDELAELVASHNRLGEALREQRQALVQRELLLDTLVQNTPVAMLLTDASGHVVLANLAARKMLGDGRRLEGRRLDDLLAQAPAQVQEAFARGGDGMFSVESEDHEAIYHLARRSFRLNGRRHELALLRELTTELRRQEVQTWKKVIRVISHELNNSLAPIASLAHSGAKLLRRGQHDRLDTIFATIEERARHLEGFIRGYARFAKLPTPRAEPIQWASFAARLRSQIPFAVDGPLPDAPLRVDPAQFEQALLNLLKNAHESGSPETEVKLRVRRAGEWWRIDVLDRGSGMSEAVLQNALVPFYSTKRSGTGLGLALAREIAEAHGGRIALANRDQGGLCVSLNLPA
ncbi:sensor histidine kinase [Vulcaniibacterium tengchongense]|uniref:sensor histidine kinase n=1 Tax=Vulcaniibacterium tengchongense TaxID=1273429 RepID=UPI003CCD4442